MTNIPHKQIPTTNSPPCQTMVMMAVDIIKLSHTNLFYSANIDKIFGNTRIIWKNILNHGSTTR